MDASPKRNSEVSKRGGPPYQEGTLPKTSKRDSVEKRGRIGTAKLGSVGLTRSWRSIYSRANGTSKPVHHTC